MIRFDDSASPRVCDHRDDGSSELDRLFLSLLPQGIPRSLHLQKGPVGGCPPLFLRSVAGFAMWRRNTMTKRCCIGFGRTCQRQGA